MNDKTYQYVLDEAEQILEGANYHHLSACSLFADIVSAVDKYGADAQEYLTPTLKFAIARGIKEWCNTL